MLCIAAFIVFAILGIFSAKYRSLTAKAWYCVRKRITFKPCDINFGEEVKSRLLGKMILKRPRLAKFLDKWLDWFAFAFVALSIWSLVSVTLAGLNLWVYDTCDPVSGESCSLSGEACGIGTNQLSLPDAISQNRFGEWLAQPFITFAETVSRIPDRIRSWDVREFLPENPSYYTRFDETKPVALEVIDPGCKFCKQLFKNIKTASFERNYNLTYIPYPIPDVTRPGEFKFVHSELVTRYLLALQQTPLTSNPSGVSPDWQLLEMMFTGSDENGQEYQNSFNLLYDKERAVSELRKMLGTIGYTDAEIRQIDQLALSDQISEKLQKNREIVEKKIKTIKIPTIMFNGRRYDRLVGPEQLQ